MFIDPPDYDEIESERQEYLREQEAEAEAEQQEAMTSDYRGDGWGLDPIDGFDYEDDPDNHPFECTCFLCIPGF